MDKIVFTIIYKHEPDANSTFGSEGIQTREISSKDFKDLLAFFEKYIEIARDKTTISTLLTVDPVIDIYEVANVVSKCFNLVYMAQNNLTNAHNILVNIHRELLKNAGK